MTYKILRSILMNRITYGQLDTEVKISDATGTTYTITDVKPNGRLIIKKIKRNERKQLTDTGGN
jgi:hypothetical protein